MLSRAKTKISRFTGGMTSIKLDQSYQTSRRVFIFSKTKANREKCSNKNCTSLMTLKMLNETSTFKIN